MIIITDLLKEPFDEGAKISTKYLVENISKGIKTYTVSINSEYRSTFINAYFKINKLLFNPLFYETLKDQQHTSILYIPEASATLFSIIRAKLINYFTGKDVFILALQPREYSLITKHLVSLFSPRCIIAQSLKSASILSNYGVHNAILPLGVDDRKYCSVSAEVKFRIRDKYKIDRTKIVLLHVGHIQHSRNLDWLILVKKANPDLEIVIVGSTYNDDDERLYSRLLRSHIRIIREHIPQMEELYHLSDYYVFPVLSNNGAIETPLSVVEAMACNLPIATTKFGSLPDTFKEDNDFIYVNSVQDILNAINRKRVSPCRNREKIHAFTWETIARKLVDIVEQ